MVVEALAALLAFAVEVTVVTEVTVFLPEPEMVVWAVTLDVLVDAKRNHDFLSDGLQSWFLHSRKSCRKARPRACTRH